MTDKEVKKARKETATGDAGLAKQARKKTPKKQGWKLVFSAILMTIWVGMSVIVAQIAVGYVMIWLIGVENFQQPVGQAFYTALSYAVALMLAILVPANLSVKWEFGRGRGGKLGVRKVEKKEAKVSRNLLGLRGLPTWTDVGLAPVGFIASMVLAGALTWVFNFFPWFNEAEAQGLGFSVYVAGFDKVLAFVALVVMAPIAEEVIFRGWLYGRMREKLSEGMSQAASIGISMTLVSLLFGAVHMQWNVGVTVFAMSIVMCALREVTGTIYAGILVHMIKNGMAFYLLYVLGMM